jgi:HEPN domain-containing protein
VEIYEVVTTFGQWFSDEYHRGGWEEKTYVHKDARRILNDMKKIVDAVELFERYNIKF